MNQDRPRLLGLLVMIGALGWAGCAGFSAPKYGVPRVHATAEQIRPVLTERIKQRFEPEFQVQDLLRARGDRFTLVVALEKPLRRGRKTWAEVWLWPASEPKGWSSIDVEVYREGPELWITSNVAVDGELAARIKQTVFEELRAAGLEIVERPAWVYSTPPAEIQPIAGSYTLGEVKGLRDALAKLPFPASPGTVAGMMSHPVKSVLVIDSHYLPDRAKKGRVGGRIVEYWLNNGWVLQVATADYVKGEERFSLEEWAAILTKTERENFCREIY